QIVVMYYVMPISYEICKELSIVPVKSGARASGYHLSIRIERKAGALFRTKKERETDVIQISRSA
ncbi:hypothetical protein ACUOCP_54180, partial [Escherichia sp. R-CC3]